MEELLLDDDDYALEDCEMKARMQMPIDTLFGNRVTLIVDCELDNPHDPTHSREVTNRELIENMARVLRYMLEEVDAQNDRERRASREGAPEQTPVERARGSG